MKKTLLFWLMLMVSVALAIISYCLLPSTVITQLSTNGSVNTMPKTVAVLIPFAFGAGGSLFSILSKAELKSKGLFLSAVGIILFIVMLAVNI